MTDARTVSSTFDSGRLILARQAARLRKNELAEKAGVSAGAISQYELGQTKPKPTVLAKIALATGMPIEFFASGRPIGRQDTVTTHFRSLRSTTQLERSQALAHAEFTWEIARELERHVRLPDLAVPTITLPANPKREVIEAAAKSVRAEWDLPTGPIPNMVRLLESKGVVVARLWSDLHRVDAFCHPFPGRPVVVLYSDKDSKDRSRFDAAHELAHLVIHAEGSEPGNQVIERQAHAFAAELLMPADVIASQLPSRVDWRRLLQLKQTWGTSMASLLYRARTLGVMSETTYRRAVTTMASRGWNRKEEGSLGPSEQPTLLAKALEVLKGEYSPDDLATNARLSASIVSDVLLPEDDRPVLEVD